MSHAAGVGDAAARARSSGRCSCCGRTRSRSATAAAGRCSSTGCSPSSTPGIHPVVPAQGSVGASGDLAPLAHLALPLIGRGPGRARTASTCPALVALREVGLEPLVLEAKEGLALLNGTQLMTGDRGAAPRRRRPPRPDGERRRGDVASRRCSAPTSRSPRPTSSPGRTPARSRSPRSSATSSATRGFQAAHKATSHKVQDPYSLRCVPQVHGAVRDALDHLRRVLDIEMNSATDNPLVFPEGGVAAEDALATGGGRVISGGNFHGEPVALALDFAKLAIAELGSISERRTALLLDARLNGGLPAFLASVERPRFRADDRSSTRRPPSSRRTRSSPIPRRSTRSRRARTRRTTSRWARSPRRHARTVLEHVERIVAIELLVAARGARPSAAPARRRGRRRGRAGRPGAGRRRRRGARAGSGPSSPPLDGDREPGPGPRRRDADSSTTARSSTSSAGSAGDARALGRDRDPDRRRHRRGDASGSIPPCADPGFDHRTLRLLGGRRSRLEGGPPRLARGRRRRRRPRARPPPTTRSPRTSREPAFNPFAPAGALERPAFNPFADDDDDEPVDNPFAPRAAGPAGGRRRRAAQARPARSRAGRLRELRQGPPRRRRRRRLRPVRAAVGLPAGPAPARALPAAARRAAAGGHHLHRDDRRGARPRPRHARWSRAVCDDLARPRLRGGRGVPGAGHPAGRDERARRRRSGSTSGFAVAVDDERFPVVRRELADRLGAERPVVRVRRATVR